MTFGQNPASVRSSTNWLSARTKDAVRRHRRDIRGVLPLNRERMQDSRLIGPDKDAPEPGPPLVPARQRAGGQILGG